jgi:small redox-active disulfide protein 2
MAEDQIRQIMINNRLIGIVGLADAIKRATQTQAGKTASEIQEFLLQTISSTNYIPASARESYGHAILRQFNIAQGLPVEPETAPGLTIAVLGMGCARCSQLESDVRDILSELKIAADLRHITDFQEIASYGAMGSPALVINNRVVAAGEVPPKSKIRQWITESCSIEKEK